MQAIVIKSDELFIAARDIDNNLETLRRIVGGRIQCIQIGGRLSLICNEEGKLLGLPRNRLADIIAGRYLRPGDHIVGDCVIVAAEGEELTDMTDEEMNSVFRQFAEQSERSISDE